MLVMMVRTQDLFEFVIQQRDRVEHRMNPTDRTEFLVVWAADLRAAGYEVKQGGDTYDVTIRLRGGEWSPFEAEEEDLGDGESDEVYGYWADEDEDFEGPCMYCGVGLASSGEVCPACGTFQV
jgi:hypothetical protein